MHWTCQHVHRYRELWTADVLLLLYRSLSAFSEHFSGSIADLFSLSYFQQGLDEFFHYIRSISTDDIYRLFQAFLSERSIYGGGYLIIFRIPGYGGKIQSAADELGYPVRNACVHCLYCCCLFQGAGQDKFRPVQARWIDFACDIGAFFF